MKEEGFGMMGQKIRFNKPQQCAKLVLTRKEFLEFKAYCRKCNMTPKEFQEVMHTFGIQIVYFQMKPKGKALTR